MKKLIPFLVLTIGVFSLSAQPAQDSIDEAAYLFRQGEVKPAIEMALRLSDASPKNGNINMFLGDCYSALGESSKAIEAYRAAQKKGINEAWLSLATLATREYRIQDAEDDIELYRKGLKKGRKTLPDESGDVVEELDKIKNMLNRVQKIVVLDSINVPAEEFFKVYRLSHQSGTLSSPDILPTGFKAADPTVVYTTEDGLERLWAAPDSAQVFSIVSSNLLFDGRWDSPHFVGNALNEGGDANYPFLMPDGVTLYFANDGDNSIGGYDIFISRRNGNEFLQPQNLGMPFNSPYNDYMMAIDEYNGIGWWATDRNRIPGHVTVYVFIPQEMRVNYEPDSPGIAGFARLSDFKATWEAGADYSALIAKIHSRETIGRQQATPEFELSVPGRGTLFFMSQIHNSQAKRLMEQWLATKTEFDENEYRLGNLRSEYSTGKTSLAEPILNLEEKQQQLRKSMFELRNQVIKLETRK